MTKPDAAADAAFARRLAAIVGDAFVVADEARRLTYARDRVPFGEPSPGSREKARSAG
jgi:hypothetical protein